MPRDRERRAEYGDFQTPLPLAREVCAHLDRRGVAPALVVEPCSGDGHFLVAAAEAFPGARIVGFELQEGHRDASRSLIAARDLAARIEVARGDLFRMDWRKLACELSGPGPLLFLGNPPWVTTSELGALGAANQPPRSRRAGVRGVDAISGSSNFDVSEWLLLRLLDAIAGHEGASVAMLVKTAVARKIAAARPEHTVTIARIDAQKAFGAAVEACLFTATAGARNPACEVYASLQHAAPERRLGVRGGRLVADREAYGETLALAGRTEPAWRSGDKHDCAAVFEIDGDPDLEPELLFPLLKGGDLARGAVSTTARRLLVPQRTLAEDPERLREIAPKAHAYLEAHAPRLAARKSRVYAARPRFAIFGVGPYTFAPWKVAISGLHKRLAFHLVGPIDGRPVVFDDTCYFLPFEDERAAREAHEVLTGPAVRRFYESRIFWDDKRPVRKAILMELDLARACRRQR